MRLRAVTSVLVLVLALATAAPLGAQERTPGLAAARARAAEATQRYDDAQAQLGELEAELARLETRATAIEAEMDDLRAEVQAIAVERYTSSGELPILLETDLNRHARAAALTRVVAQSDADAIDRYEALREDLAANRADAEAREVHQRDLLVELEDAQAAIYRELEVLEEVDRERLAEERRRAEEARRRAEEEQRRAAAAAAAAAAATSTTAAPVDVPGTPAPTTDPAPPAPPAPAPTPPGTFLCPVQGSVFFTDTFGAPRPGGRRHEGVDMMAARGTPVVAPVGGDVVHRGNSIGGLSFYLAGDDGNQYYGTHLDSYGASGRVSAGTVVGYVGSTGNAPEGAPHLHFEIEAGGRVINPYPTVAAAC